jgi:hypothetical protein
VPERYFLDYLALLSIHKRLMPGRAVQRKAEAQGVVVRDDRVNGTLETRAV